MIFLEVPLMIRAMQAAILCLCLAAALACVSVAYAVYRVPTVLAAVVHQEGDATRAMVKSELDGLTLAASDQVAAAVSDANMQLAGIRGDANRQTTAALGLIDKHLGNVTQILDARSAEYTAGVNPILRDTDVTISHLDKTIQDLHPQLLGLVAASKVAAGQTAETMRDIQRAVPDTLAELKTIETNVASTTAASADAAAKTAASAEESRLMFAQGTIVLHNLAVDTHPLPWYLRIPLQIGSLVAPLAGGIATTLAATGGL